MPSKGARNVVGRPCRRCFGGQCDEIGIDLLRHLQYRFVIIFLP